MIDLTDFLESALVHLAESTRTELADLDVFLGTLLRLFAQIA